MRRKAGDQRTEGTGTSGRFSACDVLVAKVCSVAILRHQAHISRIEEKLFFGRVNATMISGWLIPKVKGFGFFPSQNTTFHHVYGKSTRFLLGLRDGFGRAHVTKTALIRTSLPAGCEVAHIQELRCQLRPDTCHRFGAPLAVRILVVPVKRHATQGSCDSTA